MKNIFKYIFNWKYRYFAKKLVGVKKTILDLEFKRFKTREIREEIRQEYDSTNAKIQVLDAQIENEKKNKTLNKDERARLDDEKVRLTRDAERFMAQMKGLDIEVEGSKQTNEYPDGVAGINQQLDSLRELVTMIEDYGKEL